MERERERKKYDWAWVGRGVSDTYNSVYLANLFSHLYADPCIPSNNSM